MPLRRRLIALIALVLPLSFLAGGLLTYWHAVEKIETEMAAAVALGESTVRDVMGTIAQSPNPQSGLRRLVSSFDDERHVQVSLTGSEGKIIAASQIRPPARAAPEWLANTLRGQPHVSVIALPPETFPGQQLHVEAVPMNEIAEVWEDVALKLKIITGFFGLVLALVYVTLGRALRPLEKLAAALSEVGQGNFAAHVPESGPKELAAIYREFNRMAVRLQDAERQNRALNIQLNTVQEEERSDIARDLHDEIGPFLFAVDVDAQAIPKLAGRGETEDVVNRAGAIRQSVAHMQGHLRSVLSRLRPALFLDLGLSPAVDKLVAFWRKRHPDIEFAVSIAQMSFGARQDEIAFRVIQEGINNAVRHGKPSRIAIAVGPCGEGRMQVEISDNGAGFANQGSTGFGLSGMRERIASAGGTLDVTGHRDARGVVVRAVMPYGKSAVADYKFEEGRTPAL